MNKSMEPLKIIMLGKSSSGKTSIFRQYFDNLYSEDAISTINCDYRMKKLSLDHNTKISIVVWDTSGQEKYNAISKNYYKGAQGFILVYDVTDKDSFDCLDYWANAIKENGALNYRGVLIANKIDMSSRRAITSNEGEKKALELGFAYIEASSKKNINIKESFMYLGQLIYNDMKELGLINIDEGRINKISPQNSTSSDKFCS